MVNKLFSNVSSKVINRLDCYLLALSFMTGYDYGNLINYTGRITSD